MDADRTPSGRGRPAEPASWRALPDAGSPRHRDAPEPSLTTDDGPDRFDAGEVTTGVIDPGPGAGADGGPASLPEASDLFDALVTRRRSPVVRMPTPTVRSSTRGTGRPRGQQRGPGRGPRRLGWAYAAAIAVLAIALAVGVSSRAQLHRTDTELTATRARLHVTLERAHEAEAALSAVSAQAASAGHLLAAETAQLASVQSQLASTEANVFANGVSINNLDTCLSGVERALNQISLNDQPDAATTLNGVAASCRAASPPP